MAGPIRPAKFPRSAPGCLRWRKSPERGTARPRGHPLLKAGTQECPASHPRSPCAPTTRNNEIALETKGEEVHVTIDTRRYRVRGLKKNLSPHQLRVNILATRDDLVHMDTFDLCKAKSRTSFIKATAAELYIDEQLIKRDVGKLLLQLEQLHQQHIDAATEPTTPKVELTAAEKRAALKLLRSPNLTDRILADYAACGLVGEETNKLVCYLACVSRRLSQPLAVLIQSGSAAGKTSLMDATLAFMPEEDQVRYSAMTGQSLYYMGRQKPETQDPGRGRRRRRGPSRLRPEAAAKRRASPDRGRRQEQRHGPPADRNATKWKAP